MFCNLFGVDADYQIFNERDNATSFDFRFFSVVHLDLQISPRIFENTRNDPNVIFRGMGEDDS